MKQFLLIIFVMLSTSANAALNKWIDSEGRVHYSDTPPADAKVIKLRSSSGIKVSPQQKETGEKETAGSPAPKTIAEREAELKKVQQEKQADAEKVAKEKAHSDALKASCEAAQQSLRVLQEDIRLLEIDASGERSYMNDERRQENIAKAQKDVSSYCK